MFNPWSAQWDKDDTRIRKQTTSNVDQIMFNEYLHNNYGFIWRATAGLIWDYAVGSLVVTQATNALMQLIPPAERANPVLYSRTLTQLIGNRVLQGRWDGQYSDGVDPTQWVGSQPILTIWLNTDQPVRYGQCWVFAAILTTILRASGIPARTVTNYRSHHDRGLTDNRMAVLRQYDNKVQPDEPTWNYHV